MRNNDGFRFRAAWGALKVQHMGGVMWNNDERVARQFSRKVIIYGMRTVAAASDDTA